MGDTVVREMEGMDEEAEDSGDHGMCSYGSTFIPKRLWYTGNLWAKDARGLFLLCID